MNHAELINASLEKIAEQDIDLTDRIYDRFAQRCPAGMEPLSAATHVVRGRMLGEILYAFGSQGERASMIHTYMQEEAVNHAALGVTLPIYAALFDAIVDCVGEALGPDWDSATEQAWRNSAAAMLESIESGLALMPDAARAG
jgi:hemoglobin-like flavoprotein